MVQNIIPEAEVARHYGKEMSFILPAESSSSFQNLFEILDKQISGIEKNVGIEGYGVSMTTLEEVNYYSFCFKSLFKSNKKVIIVY